MSDVNPDYTKPNPNLPQPEPNDAQNNKVMAILAYILFFVPLLAARESRFAMYHANQGLILFLAAVASNVVVAIIPLIGILLAPLVTIAILVFIVLGIVNAANGQMKPLPWIGKFQLIK